MKTLPFILILLASANMLRAGNSLTLLVKKERDFFMNAELKYNYQKSSGIEAGINFTKYRFSDKIDLAENGIFLSCEYKFMGQKNIIAPKIGFGTDRLYYKFNGFGYCAKISTVMYSAEQGKDLRLLPEIGLTYLGIANLTYAYSIALAKKYPGEIPAHTISLGVNFGYRRSIINIMATGYGIYDRKRFHK